VLRLADAWIWDFWIAEDGDTFHLYFLKASRALGNPDRRHWHVTIGHAVSSDLRHWNEVADALAISGQPAFDDKTTWTGSVVRADDGTWLMFYTGTSTTEAGLKQRVGLATSEDLHHWSKASVDALLESDPEWYEQLSAQSWPDEAWRDPWVFRDPTGDGWHMLITARAATGPADQRGVIGHARSADLCSWTVCPPLSAPTAGFGQLEVPQVEVIDDHPVLVFSCLGTELSNSRKAAGEIGGIWSVPAASLTGPYDVARAVRITDESLYSGRLIKDRSGNWMMLAFRNTDPHGRFIGELTDPMPVAWNGDATALVVSAPPQPHNVSTATTSSASP